MPITVDCVCGKRYRLKDEAAGRSFACQECGEKVAVPRAKSAETVFVKQPVPASAPMNLVGLFSLFLALLSYLPMTVGIVLSAIWLYNWPPSFTADIMRAVTLFSGAALLLSGLGLLIARLSGQRIVRPFSLWGVRLSAAPFVVACLGVARIYLGRP